MSNKRALAIIDLLGISALTKEKTLAELSIIYDNFILRADSFLIPLQGYNSDEIVLFRNHPIGTPLCHRHILSDSIVLVANSDSVEDSLKVIISSWRLLQSCIAFKRPVRGAIVYDEVLSKPEQNYVIGNALVNANELEKTQDWMGIVIKDSFAKELQDEVPNLFGNFFFKHIVHCKEGEKKFEKEYWVLNWRYNFVVKEGTKSLFEGNPCLNKIENTLAFAEAVVSSGAAYPNDQKKCPAELRCMFVGDTEPPFPHGDEY
jgi:hypothetical protein